jgi:hypothetical protein
VVRAEDPLGVGEHALLHRDRLVDALCAPEARREVRARGEGLGMLVAVHARGVRDEFLLELDRLVVTTRLPERHRDVGARVQRAGMIGAALVEAVGQHAAQLLEVALDLLVALGPGLLGGLLRVGQDLVLAAEDRLRDLAGTGSGRCGRRGSGLLDHDVGAARCGVGARHDAARPADHPALGLLSSAHRILLG